VDFKRMKVKIKILIIDDEQDYCLIMKHYFESKRYEVFIANTLHSGLKLLSEEQPDILLLDNNLPDGEGWNHVEAIVSNNPTMKLHLISAYKSVKDNTYEGDNICIWEKPISMSKFDEVFLPALQS
jgi:DNA-binding NtrC family response regulator